ncbi:hypothetical protein [Roseimicrobium sp. ORNL1]|uniref:hypothetical protein n=1 Tax=Roseimicrobium sp. ORNL1 TaxID=2711231 RepID=UPI0013E1226D|nr:hypothetical protein [Roseimicrobium sp. ORNL1]QIE99969.1 hypothetical protein G5S37_29580 [Roseimicrobium sp. ORNL1]
MAKSRRFSTTALVITTMVVLIITLVLVIWLPTPKELAQRRAEEAFRRAITELSQVHIGPIRWSGITLEEAVADVNARLEKKGETDLRLFVSKDYTAMTSSTIIMDLPDLTVADCAWYLCDLSYARMSGSQAGLTFEQMRGCDIPVGDLPWRIRARLWVERNTSNLWEAFVNSNLNPTPAPGTPAAAPGTAPSPSPAPPAGADPFAPAGAP